MRGVSNDTSKRTVQAKQDRTGNVDDISQGNEHQQRNNAEEHVNRSDDYENRGRYMENNNRDRNNEDDRGQPHRRLHSSKNRTGYRVTSVTKCK